MYTQKIEDLKTALISDIATTLTDRFPYDLIEEDAVYNGVVSQEYEDEFAELPSFTEGEAYNWTRYVILAIAPEPPKEYNPRNENVGLWAECLQKFERDDDTESIFVPIRELNIDVLAHLLETIHKLDGTTPKAAPSFIVF